MRLAANVMIGDEELAAFCRRHGIVRLSLFGSALKEQLGPDSDIDLLVEFALGSVPGLLGVSALERELSELIGGVDVDLRTLGDLSPRFRGQVRDEARQLYAAA
ncbi:MAG: nucleotidyltransferase family protein [Acidimicrobiia bacterium]